MIRFFSTWAWGDYGAGIYYNREADIRLSTDANTVSYTKRITANQQAKMAEEIVKSENDTWSLTNNCSGFANKVFKAATGISFNGYPLTPKTLKSKISNK